MPSTNSAIYALGRLNTDGLEICTCTGTQVVILGPFQTKCLGHVEPNWIELNFGATLAWQLFQMLCCVCSCHPTLMLFGHKSSLVSGASNENMVDQHQVWHKWSLTEAQHLKPGWPDIVPQSCRTTKSELCAKRCRLDVVSNVELQLGNWSIQLDMTLKRPKHVVRKVP